MRGRIMDNIVLVTVDSLRADACSFMGADERTTPALDEMAETGYVFENAIAPGPTTPESLPPTFTGWDPVTPIGRHGDRLASAQDRIGAHLQARRTLPERLAAEGYTTAGFTPNPWTSEYFGFDKGFDHFEDYMQVDLSSTLWERMLEGRSRQSFKALRLLLSWVQRENVFKPWEAFYDNISSWAETAPEPYFLWVFLLDVHFPYLPSPRYRTQSRWREYEANLRLYLESQQTPYSPRVHEQLRTAYRDAVRYVDSFFARLRADLDDEAVVIVHGDHGDAFGEHGSYTHQHELYEENIHVPLLVAGGPNGSSSEPISLRSIPELVVGLARNGEVRVPERAMVTAKTDEGARLTLRGERVKYHHAGSQLYDLAQGEDHPIEHDALLALCEAYASQVREGDLERKRVKGAVERVIDAA